MTQEWLDRINNLLDIQKDRCLSLISATFTRRELIELKIIIETCRDCNNSNK